MRNYSDESKQKLSEAGKKAMSKRWEGHKKQTKEEYNAYQRKYQLDYYYKKKALKDAQNTED